MYLAYTGVYLYNLNKYWHFNEYLSKRVNSIINLNYHTRYFRFMLFCAIVLGSAFSEFFYQKSIGYHNHWILCVVILSQLYQL